MAANASKFNGCREIVDTFLCLSFFNFGQTFVLNTTNLKFECIYFHVKLLLA